MTVVGAQNSAQADVYVADTIFKKPIIYDAVKSGTFNGKNFNMLADTYTLIGRAQDKLPTDQCVPTAPQPTTSTVVTTGTPTSSSTTGAAPSTTGSVPSTTGSVPSTTGSVPSTTGSQPASTTGTQGTTTGSLGTTGSTTPEVPSTTGQSETTGTQENTEDMSSASVIAQSFALIFVLAALLL